MEILKRKVLFNQYITIKKSILFIPQIISKFRFQFLFFLIGNDTVDNESNINDSTQELLSNTEEVSSIKQGHNSNNGFNECCPIHKGTCDAELDRNWSAVTRPVFWILALSHAIWQVKYMHFSFAYIVDIR